MHVAYSGFRNLDVHPGVTRKLQDANMFLSGFRRFFVGVENSSWDGDTPAGRWSETWILLRSHLRNSVTKLCNIPNMFRISPGYHRACKHTQWRQNFLTKLEQFCWFRMTDFSFSLSSEVSWEKVMVKCNASCEVVCLRMQQCWANVFMEHLYINWLSLCTSVKELHILNTLLPWTQSNYTM